ncbi:class I glutamine amidotransferase-like protein [Biscogniauxia mediterranea]|nr:class I glutamine amidotransferase-like protein [Biscogniauxia mediterranea]
MVTVGVLALQGGFSEHLSSLRKAANYLTESQSPLPPTTHTSSFRFIEVRTPEQLASCDALVIPGGESTTLSLVAAQSGLIEPLREFVKVSKKPTWGTCAGLILLCEEASATKRGGQELIGGLDVKVHRNHFGRQIESFVTDLELPFLSLSSDGEANGTKAAAPFPAVFIRAPVVDQLLTNNTKLTDGESNGANLSEAVLESNPRATREKVEVLAILEGRHASNKKAAMGVAPRGSLEGAGDIVALRQGNVFGMSFHPELTDDIRIHVWWLHQVTKALA